MLRDLYLYLYMLLFYGTHYKLQSYVWNYNFLQFYITCVGDCMSAVSPLWRLSENAGIYSDWWCMAGTLMHLKWFFFFCTTYTLFQKTVWDVLYIQSSYFFKMYYFVFWPILWTIYRKCREQVINSCTACRSNRCTDVSPADGSPDVQKCRVKTMYICKSTEKQI